MAYYLFGNINDIIENYYSDIHFTKTIQYNDASGCYLDNIIVEMKKIIADADVNYFKDCDYLIVVCECCVPYDNVVFANHHKLLYELDDMLKHVRYMLISSATMSTIFDADVAICKDNYIRMTNIFHGLDWLRNIGAGYTSISCSIDDYIIQSICRFQIGGGRGGCVGGRMTKVCNSYFTGYGVSELIDISGLSYHYSRDIALMDATKEYVRNRMCLFQKWVYKACEFYKKIFISDCGCGAGSGTGTGDDYIFIYMDGSGSQEKVIIENIIPSSDLVGKNYLVWNNYSGIGYNATCEPYNKVFDKYEYNVCMFILMCRAEKIYHISTIDEFWKKDGLVNVAEDFWDRDVVRVGCDVR